MFSQVSVTELPPFWESLQTSSKLSDNNCHINTRLFIKQNIVKYNYINHKGQEIDR